MNKALPEAGLYIVGDKPVTERDTLRNTLSHLGVKGKDFVEFAKKATDTALDVALDSAVKLSFLATAGVVGLGIGAQVHMGLQAASQGKPAVAAVAALTTLVSGVLASTLPNVYKYYAEDTPNTSQLDPKAEMAARNAEFAARKKAEAAEREVQDANKTVEPQQSYEEMVEEAMQRTRDGYALKEYNNTHQVLPENWDNSMDEGIGEVTVDLEGWYAAREQREDESASLSNSHLHRPG